MSPLGLVDSESIVPRDLAVCDLVYADRTGEIYQGVYNADHLPAYKLPDEMPLRLGALSEPLTSCIRAFARAQKVGGFPWNATVVIQGTGFIAVGVVVSRSAQETSEDDDNGSAYDGEATTARGRVWPGPRSTGTRHLLGTGGY